MKYTKLFTDLKLNQGFFAGRLKLSKSRFSEMLKQKNTKHEELMRTHLRDYATDIIDNL